MISDHEHFVDKLQRGHAATCQELDEQLDDLNSSRTAAEGQAGAAKEQRDILAEKLKRVEVRCILELEIDDNMLTLSLIGQPCFIHSRSRELSQQASCMIPSLTPSTCSD